MDETNSQTPAVNVKEEYRQKKENKEREAQKRANKIKDMKRVRRLAWMVVIMAIGWVTVRFATRDDKPSQHVGEYFQAQSREHIAEGITHPSYNSNPPTGGWHYADPAKTGVYDEELPDEQVIHNLEHSHIWFAYKPDLSADQIEMLVKIAKDYGSRVIMTPRAANDVPVAIVAWERLLKLETVEGEKIKSFVEAYRNKAGPEKNIPDFDFKDWRAKR